MKKLGILCASDEELAPFLPHIQQCRTTEKSMLRFHEGTLRGIAVVALYCGVCKVNAALATQILIDSYGVDAVLNAGVAGGMASHIRLFDTVISTQVAYHDVADDVLTEFHPWLPSVYFDADPALLDLAKAAGQGLDRVFFGRMVAGEQFIADRHRDKINEKFAPLSTDMETGAIAHVCYVNKIPFLAIRSITDTADRSGVDNFEQNCQRASEIARDVSLAFLDEAAKH